MLNSILFISCVLYTVQFKLLSGACPESAGPLLFLDYNSIVLKYPLLSLEKSFPSMSSRIRRGRSVVYNNN